MPTEVEKAYKFKIDKAARKGRRSQPRAVAHRYTAKFKGEESPRAELYKVRETTPEEAEVRCVASKLAREFAAAIEVYKSPSFGAQPHAEAVDSALAFNESHREAARNMPVEEIRWSHLSAIAEASMVESLAKWTTVRDAADNELETGARAAQITGELQPYEYAQYLAIRDAFCDEWRPRGGIELAMIDMLTVAFSLQMYWSGIAHQRATGEHDEQNKSATRYEPKGWKSPYQWKADAIEQAYRLADGYNRQFLRVLRQLRDLRRYAPPVIVNNGGQVNVAANGGQQVNVAK